jgi:rhodanese-related sulfurtransferase
LKFLAVVALVLGGLAVVAGTPQKVDHVTAVELARWIRDRKPDLRLVDLRDSAEFEAYHLPRAEWVPLEKLAAAPFKGDETIVLYSGGGAHTDQASEHLRSLGFTNVYVLGGGVAGWLDEVMNPSMSANASAAERIEMDSVAALSRYFGGVPRESDPSAAAAVSSVARVRRRGC